MKKFIKICEYVLLLLFLVLIPFFTNKIISICVVPFFFLLSYVSKKIPSRYFAYFLFGFAFFIRIISLFFLKVEIVDDFLTMLKASRDLLNGNLNFMKSSYFLFFSYQVGHVLYQAFLLKIINSVLFLQIVNSIITSFSIVLLYLIGKKIVKEDTAKKLSIFYLFYFYPLYLNSVLTNQLLPALLCLLAVYYYITHDDNWKKTIVVGVLLVIANFLRTESIIWIMAICFYQLFVMNGPFKKRVMQSGLLLVCYFITSFMIANIVFVTPIHSKLNNQYPGWKFYCGLSVEHNGLYNSDDEMIYFSSNQKKELLQKRIQEYKFQFPILFLKKEVILWTQTNYDLQLKKPIPNVLYLFNQGFLNIILLLFIVGLIPNRKDKKKEVLLLKLLLGMYYVIYLFIEISPRYAYIMHFLVFLFVGYGIERIEEWYRKRDKYLRILSLKIENVKKH